LLVFTGKALTYSSVGAGNWSDVNIWDDGGGAPAATTPGVGDNVIIYHDVSLDVDASVGSLDIGAAGKTLTIPVGFSLTVTGAVTDGAAGAISVGGAFSANAITLDVAGLSLNNSGTVTVTTTFSMTGVSLTNSGILNIGTDFYVNNGSFDNSGTVDVSGTGTFDNNPVVVNTGTIDFGGLLDINTNGGSWTNTGGTVNGHGGINVDDSNINPCLSDGTVNYWGTLSEVGTCKITGNVATLPVELQGFYGFQLGDAIQLEWSTASEKDNDFFMLEYSFDGIGFRSIGELDGSGTVSYLSRYHFVHENPAVGYNYYRLQQVDFDGSSDYSDIISVFYEKNSLLVYPTVLQKGDDLHIQGDVEVESVRFISMSTGITFSPRLLGNSIATSRLPRDGYRLQLIVGGALHDIPLTVQ